MEDRNLLHDGYGCHGNLYNLHIVWRPSVPKQNCELTKQEWTPIYVALILRRWMDPVWRPGMLCRNLTSVIKLVWSCSIDLFGVLKVSVWNSQITGKEKTCWHFPPTKMVTLWVHIFEILISFPTWQTRRMNRCFIVKSHDHGQIRWNRHFP